MKAIHEIIASLNKPKLGVRITILVVSLVIMGIGVGCFKIIGFGTDPCATFTFGVSGITGVAFGHCQLAFNLLMFIPVIVFGPRKIGLGTVLNMVLTGYIADFVLYITQPWIPADGLRLTVRWALFAVTLVAFLVAAACYMAVELGVAPYDAVPEILAEHCGRLSYRSIRMMWDIGFLTAGFLLGAVVGITTLTLGFFLGPAVSFCAKKLRPMLE